MSTKQFEVRADHSLLQSSGLVEKAIEQIPTTYVRGRFADRSISAGTAVEITPNVNTLDGATSFISGDKFIADKDGVYFLSTGSFHFNQNTSDKIVYVRIYAKNGVMKEQRQNRETDTFGSLLADNTTIFYLEKDEYVRVGIYVASAVTTIINTESTNAYFTFGRIETIGGGAGAFYPETVSTPYVTGRFTDKALGAEVTVTMTPDASTLTGRASYILGDKFLADKPGLYFLNTTAYTGNIESSIKTSAIMHRSVNNVTLKTITTTDSTTAAPIRVGNTAIVWLEPGEYFVVNLRANVAQTTILAEALNGFFTFGRIDALPAPDLVTPSTPGVVKSSDEPWRSKAEDDGTLTVNTVDASQTLKGIIQIATVAESIKAIPEANKMLDPVTLSKMLRGSLNADNATIFANPENQDHWGIRTAVYSASLVSPEVGETPLFKLYGDTSNQWYTVLTIGNPIRATQIAVQNYIGTNNGRIFMRTRHIDNQDYTEWQPWQELPSKYSQDMRISSALYNKILTAGFTNWAADGNLLKALPNNKIMYREIVSLNISAVPNWPAGLHQSNIFSGYMTIRRLETTYEVVLYADWLAVNDVKNYAIYVGRFAYVGDTTAQWMVTTNVPSGWIKQLDSTDLATPAQLKDRVPGKIVTADRIPQIFSPNSYLGSEVFTAFDSDTMMGIVYVGSGVAAAGSPMFDLYGDTTAYSYVVETFGAFVPDTRFVQTAKLVSTTIPSRLFTRSKIGITWGAWTEIGGQQGDWLVWTPYSGGNLPAGITNATVIARYKRHYGRCVGYLKFSFNGTCDVTNTAPALPLPLPISSTMIDSAGITLGNFDARGLLTSTGSRTKFKCWQSGTQSIIIGSDAYDYQMFMGKTFSSGGVLVLSFDYPI
jgi:hypothetical protein